MNHNHHTLYMMIVSMMFTFIVVICMAYLNGMAALAR